MKRIRRFLDFVLSRFFLITFLSALFILVFYLAMHTANIWILIDEGLNARAGVVLTGEDADSLTNYFKEDFLAQDPVLSLALTGSSPYGDYSIRSYRHTVKMLSVWCWPWENTARAEVIESVPYINGTILSEKRGAAIEAGGEERLSPPAWDSCRYRISLVRNAGRWKISGMQLVERVEQ